MLSRYWQRRHARGERDAGVSLIELIVGMVLMAIFGAVTARLFVTVNNSASASTDRSIDAASAGTVMSAWAEYLRVADGLVPGSSTNRFEWITPNDMAFYADLNNRPSTGSGLATTTAPTMFWLRLDTKKVLIEEQFPAGAVQGTAPSRCRRLAGNVSAGNGATSGTIVTSLFSAFDLTGADMSKVDLGTAPTPSAGCQNLPVTVPSQQQKPDATAAANLPAVGRVQIDFTVADTTNKHPIGFETVVTLPTLGGS